MIIRIILLHNPENIIIKCLNASWHNCKGELKLKSKCEDYSDLKLIVLLRLFSSWQVCISSSCAPVSRTTQSRAGPRGASASCQLDFSNFDLVSYTLIFTISQFLEMTSSNTVSLLNVLAGGQYQLVFRFRHPNILPELISLEKFSFNIQIFNKSFEAARVVFL